MALNKNELKQKIIALMTDMRNQDKISDDEYAECLANAIDFFVRSAKIEYESGLTSPQGPVTGTFNGKLT